MATTRDRWYHQPVLWLGVAILLASIAGCIGLIILASRHSDESLRPHGDELLSVPVTRAPQRPP